ITAEREVIFEEARIEQDNPKTAIIRQLYGLVFADHPYGRPVLGTTETMNAATQEKLKAFNHQYYTPENMALVVVGPVTVQALRDSERIVSSISMTNSSLQLSGIIYVQAALEAADVEKAERRILEEIARIQREGPTEEERQLAVTKAESEHAFSYETSDGVAAAYGLAQTMGKLEDELRYLERLRTVTREQIRDAARKYLPLTDYARIAFVPGKAK